MRLSGTRWRAVLRHELPGGRRIQCDPWHQVHRRPDAANADLGGASDGCGESVIGQPHPSGRAALSMLEEEGLHLRPLRRHFRWWPDGDRRTDQIRTVRESTAEIHLRDCRRRHTKMLVVTGTSTISGLLRFGKARAEEGNFHRREAAELLEVDIGDEVLAVPPLMAWEINFDGIIGTEP